MRKHNKKDLKVESKKTYGIKLENRTQLATYPFAAHALTYGGEIYKQKAITQCKCRKLP
ncbi:hemin receptor [Proteus mirabilis]|uniref:Hemin receptor n=1 Tax=Proteus mirabilis TaxID=584 RepID=A0A2X2DR11_PROMI|nr:hemin receptor [Proteus mirabilis]